MAKSKSRPIEVKPSKNPEGLKLLRTFRGHKDQIFGIAFSPDGRKIATCSRDRVVTVWKSTSVETKSLSTITESKAFCIAFSPDGRMLALGSSDNHIYLLDSESLETISILEGHTGSVNSVSFSPNGWYLASGSFDSNIKIWDYTAGKIIHTISTNRKRIFSTKFNPDNRTVVSSSFRGNLTLCSAVTGQILSKFGEHKMITPSVCFSPDGKLIASGSIDKSIRIWDSVSTKLLISLEEHSGTIMSVVFSYDGKLLATKSSDHTIRIWRTDLWQTVAIIDEPCIRGKWPPEMAFHPTKPILAAHAEKDLAIKLWEMDYSVLLGSNITSDSKPYTTAKIALVGDSGVGKTGLGWRIAHREFKEHSSTHGQQFWVIDELGKRRKDGTQCEAVLWDLAGQQDYRIVHALFLKDVDIALVLFDPGNREKLLSGVEYWLKQLSNDQKTNLKTILVGARIDRGQPTMTKQEFDDFCSFHNIQGNYIATSAKKGDGVNALMNKLKKLIPWEEMPATITTSTFKKVKEFVLGLKEDTSRVSVLVNPKQLRTLLRRTDSKWKFTDAEMMTAVGHLETHGYVTVCQGTDGKESILLHPDVLINLAASMVLEARGNPQGLGVLEEKRLLSGEYSFTDLKGIRKPEKEVLLDSATALFLNQNICFREPFVGTSKPSLLVFPSLINEKRPKTGEAKTEDNASYKISGSIENVYAAMVVLLGYTDNFTRKNHWHNQAQYELGKDQICGFRQISEHEGEIEITLYYNKKTPDPGRRLFQGLFETFLQTKDVIITRYSAVVCPNCGEIHERASVMNRIEKKEYEIFCSACGEKTTIPKPIDLTLSSDVDRSIVKKEERIVKQRTIFETTLVSVKSILRNRKEIAEKPTCFISYAWGVKKHEKWVYQLAQDLQSADINVLYDQWDNQAPGNITKFISKIDSSDFSIAVGTKNYLKKYKTKEKGSVLDAEIRLMESRLCEDEDTQNTVIPILLEGTKNSAFPPLLRAQVYIDFTNEEEYFAQLFRLILTLNKIPMRHPGLIEKIESLKPKEF